MQVSRQIASNLGTGLPYDGRSFNPFGTNGGRYGVNPKNLNELIAPVQFERWTHDIADWRNAMREMERYFFPFRVAATRIYIDTCENPFVKALINRMQGLVLQRFPIIQKWQIDPNKPNSGRKLVTSFDLTQTLAANYWFGDYRQYVLDAILWGFRLISLGDLDTSTPENLFPNLQFIRPENIRIDTWRGALMTSLPYYIDGINVQYNPEVEMWNHYIDTISNRGVSTCGYGLLYNISEYAIHLHNLLGWRLDFIEDYGQPIRVAYSNKTGKALQKIERFLDNPNSKQWIVLNEAVRDRLELLSADGGSGTGWKSHELASVFLKKELSLMCLGHEDAMMTTPGKVGANVTNNKDGFNESSMEVAINGMQDKYSNYEIKKMNTISMPAFRKLSKHVGLGYLDFVPKGYIYNLSNDKEEQEVSRRFNSKLIAMSTWLGSLYNAGLKPANVADINAMIPEIPSGFVEFIPVKELDEKRESDTKVVTDSLDKPNVKSVK